MAVTFLVTGTCFGLNWTNYPITGVLNGNETFLEASNSITYQITSANLFNWFTKSATNANEIWISPVGINGSGNGSQANPYIATNAVTFDGLFPWTNFFPINTKIHLNAGTFHDTNGLVMQTGYDIDGAGRNKTIIQRDPGAGGYNNDIIGGNVGYLPLGRSNMMVENLTIDMNEQNQAWSNTYYRAVTLTGDNATIKNVEVINWGLAITNQEQFILNIWTYGGNFYGSVQTNAVHHALIDGCILGSCANMVMAPNAGVDFLSMGGYGFNGNASNNSPPVLSIPDTLTVTNGWLLGGEIKNCSMDTSVTTDTTGGLMTPGYFNFICNFGFIKGFKVDGNYIRDINQIALASAAVGIYSESNAWQDWEICNNYMVNVFKGIFINSTTSYLENNLNIHDNTIFYSGSQNSIGIHILGLTSTNLNNVTIRNNMSSAYLGAVGTNTEALLLYNTTNTVVTGNYFNNYGGLDAYIYNNVSMLTWFANWNGQGTNPIQNATNTYYPNTLKADVFQGGIFSGQLLVIENPISITSCWTNTYGGRGTLTISYAITNSVSSPIASFLITNYSSGQFRKRLVNAPLTSNTGNDISDISIPVSPNDILAFTNLVNVGLVSSEFTQ